MTRDRASAVATAVITVAVHHLRSPDAHKEIADILREEFHDIQQQTLNEMQNHGQEPGER